MEMQLEWGGSKELWAFSEATITGLDAGGHQILIKIYIRFSQRVFSPVGDSVISSGEKNKAKRRQA